MTKPLLVLALLLGLPAWLAAAPAVTPFSMQLHSTCRDTELHSEAIARVKAAGIRQVRDEIQWALIEKEKGVFAWPDYVDANVDTTLAAGIEPLIILDYGNPLYDNGNAPDTPEVQAGFVEYCRQNVTHFKNRVKYWEIWKPKADAEKYTETLKAAYKACKEANPDCVIVGVCTAGVDLKFIREVLEYGGMDYMDILSVHPCCYPNPPELSIASQLAQVRKLMDEHGGRGKPIWVTEIGWPTHTGTTGVTPEVQAHMLVRAYMECIGAGVETVFWYWLGNDGADRSCNEHNFGIRNKGGSAKPAYIACQTMTRLLDGARYARSLALGGQARARIFRREEETVAVLWTIENLQTVTLKVGSGPVEVFHELGGEPEILYPVNGLIGLTLSEAPIYLKCDEDLTRSAVYGANPFELSPLIKDVPAGNSVKLEMRIANPFDSRMIGDVLYTVPGAKPERIPFEVQSKGRTEVTINVTPPKETKEPWPISVTILADDRPAALLSARLRVVPPVKTSLEPLAPEPGKTPIGKLGIEDFGSMPVNAGIEVTCEPAAGMSGS